MNDSTIHAIAIIGISGRFPGANNHRSFWENICSGKEFLASFSDDELIHARRSKADTEFAFHVKKRGVLDGVEFFDSDFFKISPRETELMDPQHRLFLECSYEALEDAGYDPDRYSGTIGVYGGSGRSTYLLHNLLSSKNFTSSIEEYLIRTGNEADFLSTRVSYKLNLKGPSLSIQTACSSSLVAICNACNHLLSYQCDMALAGGVSIFVPQNTGYLYEEGMIFSPNGHCMPFDASAKGTVPANGIGVVVLKRLEDAIQERDHIYAVIRGYGINNDGGERISYSAPSVLGQMKAIESAFFMAEVDPETVGYIETHGTGTILGDPIEVEALKRVFQAPTKNKACCALGSVKANIGHCMEAAGVVGLIHAVMALYYKKIPQLIHFKTLNPQIDLEDTPFYINRELKDWNKNEIPRRAGVSSFGIGGTNAHIILEEAPESFSPSYEGIPHLIVLSGKTQEALEKAAVNLASYLTQNRSVSLENVAYTLQVGRKFFAYRKAYLARNFEELIFYLSNPHVSFAPSTELEKYCIQAGELWVSGQKVNWFEFWTRMGITEFPRRVPLPTYPFERKKYWVDSCQSKNVRRQPYSKKKKSKLLNIEKKITAIWKELLACEKVGLQDNFFLLGGDSLLTLQVASQIEEELGVNLNPQTLYRFPTIEQLSEIIREQALDEEDLILLKEGNGPPLFLIHGIEGSCFPFIHLANAMKFKGPIFGIEASSDFRKEKGIEKVASEYIAKMKKIQKNGPFLICGFSFGGIIAFEIGKQLALEQNPPKYLGMIDVLCPLHPKMPLQDEKNLLIFLAELLRGEEILVSSEKKQSSTKIIESLISSIGLDVLPRKKIRQISQLILEHLKMLKDYNLGTYFQKVEFFEAKQKFFRLKEESLAESWRSSIRGELVVHEVAGNHLEILKPSYVPGLASILDATLLTLQV